MKFKPGQFIAIESSDRLGKDTVINRLMKDDRLNFFNLFYTREPGGTGCEIAEQIRQLLLDKKYKGTMSSETEVLLYAASRAQHLKEVINPELAKGNTVISNRFYHSSIVYQTEREGIDRDLVEKANWVATNGFRDMPNHVIVMYLDDEKELIRRFTNTVGERDRIELEQLDFFINVNRKFKMLKSKSSTLHKIECSGTKDEVYDKVLKVILKILIDNFDSSTLYAKAMTTQEIEDCAEPFNPNEKWVATFDRYYMPVELKLYNIGISIKSIFVCRESLEHFKKLSHQGAIQICKRSPESTKAYPILLATLPTVLYIYSNEYCKEFETVFNIVTEKGKREIEEMGEFKWLI